MKLYSLYTSAVCVIDCYAVYRVSAQSPAHLTSWQCQEMP